MKKSMITGFMLLAAFNIFAAEKTLWTCAPVNADGTANTAVEKSVNQITVKESGNLAIIEAKGTFKTINIVAATVKNLEEDGKQRIENKGKKIILDVYFDSDMSGLRGATLTLSGKSHDLTCQGR